jgi:uncharacterized protein (TIGR02145 family)
MKLFQILIALSLLITSSCKKENNNPEDKPLETDSTFTDTRDGLVYRKVKIGDQIWMAENLRATKYRNGEEIATTSNPRESIFEATEPKYQWANEGNENNTAIYGRLYTWHAIVDNRGVCPIGWHVSTDDEWKTLEMYLGMSQEDADKISEVRGTNEGSKLAGSENLWNDGNLESNLDFDSVGFKALPGGNRYGIGNFSPVGGIGTWWTSSSETNTGSWYREINSNKTYIYRGLFHVTSAHSVRCVKD